MRALLIVNPNATSTTASRRDLIVSALRSALELEVVLTRYRGDATRLAAAAAEQKFGLVLTLGGDGTVNEAVNGLLGRDGPDLRADAAELPALAALPGGSANVFIRSLGLPDDPVDAAARLIGDLQAGRERVIGVGRAGNRYFTFNAGIGLDAEVVRAVDGMRAHGRSLTPALFARAALRQYFGVTDRRQPAIRISEPEGLGAGGGMFLCIVSNSAPWTYLGRRPVTASPAASFDTGLDLLGFRRLGTAQTLRTFGQMISGSRGPRGRQLVSAHDLPALTLTADRPLAFQLDGEYTGEVEGMTFRSVPRALRVVG